MRRLSAYIAVALLVGGCAIAAGAWWTTRSVAAHASEYDHTTYTCPMHPEYRSDHPGDCPVCGMDLEPLPAHEPEAEVPAAPTTPPGTTQVSATRQQAIGVRVGVVTRSAARRAVRTIGRVVADENRTYPVVAAVSGWIRTVANVATGDVVNENQVLASFLAPEVEFRTAQQSYFTGLEAFYRLAVTQTPTSSSAPTPAHAASGPGAIDRMADELRALGVTNSQLRELAARREIVQDIRVESPVRGVVLARNAAPGQRFDRGFEFYRIADLGRVWILADLDREQAAFARPGATVHVTVPGGGPRLSAIVSPAEALFDPATLTLKVRLEAANPRMALKPGMFVDVELPADVPEGVLVPADAIVDSGLRKTVFVEREPGAFEPREITTGARVGDDVVVIAGLTPGERIVISGTFFIDSESRMKARP